MKTPTMDTNEVCSSSHKGWRPSSGKTAGLWKRTLALALGGTLLLSGCGGKTEKEPEPTVAPTPSPVAESSAPKDYSKYNAYLELSDEIYEMEGVLSAYFTIVDYAPEFALVEGGDYAALKETFQFYTGNSYPARQALEYAGEDPAYPAADEAVKNLDTSPSDVMTALEHIAAYLRFDDYEEDSLAKAPELHAELWAALETYDQYYGVFLSAMDDLDRQTEDEDLAQLLEEGELILYHTRSLLQNGNDILDDIMAQVSAAAETDPAGELGLPAIDLTVISGLVAQFQTHYDSLIQALDTQEEREKVDNFTGTAGDAARELFTTRLNALYNAMGQLAGVLMDGTDYTDAFNSTIDALNTMVDEYNRII